jgi:DNA-binding GntR family transcriptional regulator
VAETLRIELDRSSPVPLYHQVATAIEEHIQSGTLTAGDFLENEVALAARLGISRPTARQALQELVDKGRLVRKRGVGTRVAPERIRRTVELTSLQADLERAGRHPSTEVLDYETVGADADVAAAMEIPVGTPVLHVERLRLADDEPLAVLRNYLYVQTAPSREELETHGLYEALRMRGIQPAVARQRIGARTATEAEAKTLDEEPHSALLTMERTAYDDTGKVVEFGRHIYRASRYMFDATLFAH